MGTIVAPPFLILESCEYMPFGFSNFIPISLELQLQCAQLRTHGPDCAACSEPRSDPADDDSRLLTDRGDVQMGH
jgi:hypothetical protein